MKPLHTFQDDRESPEVYILGFDRAKNLLFLDGVFNQGDYNNTDNGFDGICNLSHDFDVYILDHDEVVLYVTPTQL